MELVAVVGILVLGGFLAMAQIKRVMEVCIQAGIQIINMVNLNVLLEPVVVAIMAVAAELCVALVELEVAM